MIDKAAIKHIHQQANDLMDSAPFSGSTRTAYRCIRAMLQELYSGTETLQYIHQHFPPVDQLTDEEVQWIVEEAPK